jgi:hypothetical protein
MEATRKDRRGRNTEAMRKGRIEGVENLARKNSVQVFISRLMGGRKTKATREDQRGRNTEATREDWRGQNTEAIREGRIEGVENLARYSCISRLTGRREAKIRRP